MLRGNYWMNWMWSEIKKWGHRFRCCVAAREGKFWLRLNIPDSSTTSCNYNDCSESCSFTFEHHCGDIPWVLMVLFSLALVFSSLLGLSWCSLSNSAVVRSILNVQNFFPPGVFLFKPILLIFGSITLWSENKIFKYLLSKLYETFAD